jgi:hypothetical protein
LAHLRSPLQTFRERIGGRIGDIDHPSSDGAKRFE